MHFSYHPSSYSLPPSASTSLLSSPSFPPPFFLIFSFLHLLHLLSHSVLLFNILCILSLNFLLILYISSPFLTIFPFFHSSLLHFPILPSSLLLPLLYSSFLNHLLHPVLLLHTLFSSSSLSSSYIFPFSISFFPFYPRDKSNAAHHFLYNISYYLLISAFSRIPFQTHMLSNDTSRMTFNPSPHE